MLKKKMAGIFFVASALFATLANAAETGPGAFDVDAVRFSRVSTPSGIQNTVEKRTWYWGWAAPTYYANSPHFGWYQANTNKPSGTTGNTQYFKFKFKSEGLFTSAPCGHLAFIVRWDGDFGASYNRGRGLTVGDTGRNPDIDCAINHTTLPGYASTQGEYWKVGQGIVLADKASNLLVDYKEYDVEIHVADTGYAYWVRDPVTNVVLVNQYHYIPDDGSVDWDVNQLSAQGIAVALVFSGTGLVKFTAYNFKYGWF